jgi:hypothetical protein
MLKQQQLHEAALYPFMAIVLFLGLATNYREMLTGRIDRRQMSCGGRRQCWDTS